VGGLGLGPPWAPLNPALKITYHLPVAATQARYQLNNVFTILKTEKKMYIFRKIKAIW